MVYCHYCRVFTIVDVDHCKQTPVSSITSTTRTTKVYTKTLIGRALIVVMSLGKNIILALCETLDAYLLALSMFGEDVCLSSSIHSCPPPYETMHTLNYAPPDSRIHLLYSHIYKHV